MIAAAKVVKKAIPAGQDNEAEAPIHPADGHGDPVFEDEPRELPALGEPLPEVSEVSRPPKPRRPQIQFQRPNMTATCCH